MKSDGTVIWRTWPYILACIVGGIAFIAGAYPFAEAHPFWSHVISEIGIAAVVAGIVGGAIDWLFSKRLAEDVFKATVGYLLPEELRPELHWIYEQRFLCTESSQTYDFKIKDDNTVLMKITSMCILRNVSNGKQKINAWEIGVDKGVSEKYLSRLIEIGYRVGKNECSRKLNEGDCEVKNRTISPKDKAETCVARGEELHIWWTSEQSV